MNVGNGAGTSPGERPEPPGARWRGARAEPPRARAEPRGVRAALAAERTATLAQVAGLEREFSDIVAASQAANADDEHDPEGATIAYERQHVVALLEQARTHLAAIDDAVARLDAGGYGYCEGCGQPIAPERLAARPTATRCVACASGRRRR